MARNTATGDNVGPAVNVISWFLVVTEVLAIIARIATKRVLSTWGLDDVLILVTLIPSIAIAVVVGFQTSSGLGQHIATLSDGQLQTFQKASYAEGLLYILVVSLSKISVLVFLRSLTPVRLHRITINAVLGFVTLWAVSAFLAAAVRCAPPTVWAILNTSQCFNLRAFWTYHNISNIVLELCITIFPCLIVMGLKTRSLDKARVISCFVTRILVVGALVGEVVLRNLPTSRSDPTFSAWTIAVSQAFVQSFSIITACIPYLKPFLTSLQSGMIRTDDMKRRAGNVKANYTTSALNGLRVTGKASTQFSASRKGSVPGPVLPLDDMPTSKQEEPPTSSLGRQTPQWDAESHTSTAMMITGNKEIVRQ